jgi:uncharacterized protein with GYD domain
MEGAGMPKYVTLMKLTDAGAIAADGSPEWIEAARARWKALGGKMDAVFVVLGEYDFIAIGDAPSDCTALAWSAAMAKTGTVRTTTLKAWDVDDWRFVLREASDQEIKEVGSPPGPTRRKRDD